MTGMRSKAIYIVGAAIAVVQFAIIGAELGWFAVTTLQLTPVLGILLLLEGLIAVADWIESEARAQAQADSIVRQRLMERVSAEWIKGVLQPSLDETQIDLTLHTRAERPGMRERVLQKKGDPDYRLDNTIARHFVEMKRNLVITGASGSGKTMLMIQLMNALLQEAQTRESRPIPVLFNLASWSVEHNEFEAWLASELERNYGFGEQLAREWARGERLVWLLDGLDEVAAERRDECVDAINSFVTRKRQVVIACRTSDFAAVREQLAIKKVVEILPLGEPVARATLEREFVVEKADAILDMAGSSPALAERVHTPLMINAIAQAYETDDLVFQPVADESTEATLRRMVIKPFLQKRLAEQSDSYAPDDARRFLAWMAHNLRRRGRRIFYVERLHKGWLPRQGPSRRGPRLPIESGRYDLRWQFVASWRQLLRGALKGLRRFALIYLPIIAVAFVALSSAPPERLAAIFDISAKQGLDSGDAKQLSDAVSEALLVAAAAIGVVMLVAKALRAAWNEVGKGTEIDPRSEIGAGLAATWQHSLLGSLLALVFVVFGVLLILALQEIGGFVAVSVNRDAVALTLPGADLSLPTPLLALGAPLAILAGWHFSGGGTAILRAGLRLNLYRRKLTPRRFDEFVASMARAGILCRVGSGAFFIHREAQDYFADLWNAEYAAEYGAVMPL